MKQVFALVFLFLFNAPVVFAQKDTLIVGVYESPPFVIYQENGSLDGVSIWLWNEIEKELDRPFKLIRYPEGHSLKRILEDLESGVIDISINPLTITSKRSESMDFTHAFYIGNLIVAKNSSSRLHVISGLLSEFFNSRVLLLIGILIGMVIFFGIIIWLVERKNQHFDRSFQGLLTSFWWSAVTMTTVGYGDKVPISNLGRFIAFIWMLCSVVIISVFTASITSGLTVRRLATADLSVESFSRSRVGTVEASAAESYLERNFFKNMVAYENLKSGLSGLSADEVEYFIYDEPWLVYEMRNDPEFAEMELLPVRFNLELYAMALHKGVDDSLKKEIAAHLIQILESRDWKLLLEQYQLEVY